MGNLVAEPSKSNNILSGYCPYCGSRTHSDGSHSTTPLVRNVYARCTNKRCGHRFLLQISYLYTIEEPKFFEVSLDLPKSPRLKKREKAKSNDN
ncbi:MAG: ogr/Delta-like zinc finger family protein [Zymomonas mobilis]|uniref:ogr/Delta-like zinc finger family protein n=1 Tax=Zymomonas mobilis TaxID=542 RepID=UPI0039EB0354